MTDIQGNEILIPVANWWLTIVAFIAGALIVSAIVAYLGRSDDASST